MHRSADTDSHQEVAGGRKDVGMIAELRVLLEESAKKKG
jgi:hypothetical protein